MNNFVYSTIPHLSAQIYPDEHLGKLRLEFSQMLSTAISKSANPKAISSLGGVLTKPSFQHHPCTIWVGWSWHTWKWSYECLVALNTLYGTKYKTTKTSLFVEALRGLSEVDFNFNHDDCPPPFLAMPEMIKSKYACLESDGIWKPSSWEDAIKAYQEYLTFKVIGSNQKTAKGRKKMISEIDTGLHWTINQRRPDWYVRRYLVSYSRKPSYYMEVTETEIDEFIKNASKDVLFFDPQGDILYKVYLCKEKTFIPGWMYEE